MSESPAQPASSAPPPKKPAGLKIVNNEQRPLMFRITGRTIRIAPGDVAEIPGEHHAAAPELQALCAKGAVQILRTHPAETEAPAREPALEAASGKPAADKTAKPEKSPARTKLGS